MCVLRLLFFVFSSFSIYLFLVASILVEHQFGLICSMFIALPTQNRKQTNDFLSLSLSLLLCRRWSPDLSISMLAIWCTTFRDCRSPNEQKRRAYETNWETRSVGYHFKLNYLNLFHWNRCERARIATNFLLYVVRPTVRTSKSLYFMPTSTRIGTTL